MQSGKDGRRQSVNAVRDFLGNAKREGWPKAIQISEANPRPKAIQLRKEPTIYLLAYFFIIFFIKSGFGKNCILCPDLRSSNMPCSARPFKSFLAV